MSALSGIFILSSHTLLETQASPHILLLTYHKRISKLLNHLNLTFSVSTQYLLPFTVNTYAISHSFFLYLFIYLSIYLYCKKNLEISV